MFSSIINGYANVFRKEKIWNENMKALILFVGWAILFVLCWPIALLALILFPIVWLFSLPLRLIGFSMEAILALIWSLFLLPSRLLGWRRNVYRV